MFTEMVQKVFAATEPPLKLMLVPPAVAVTVPPHPLFRFAGLAIAKPVGRVSLNARPFSVMLLEFVILNVRDVVPFSGIVGAPNVLLMLGGDTTVIVAVAVLPVPPSVEVTAPVVFVSRPAALPVTLSEIVQKVFAATVPPVRLMFVPPPVAVTDPPHPLFTFGGVATMRPAGNESMNARPFKAIELELVILNVSEVLVFSGIVGAPKVLVMLGGATTVMLAVAVLPVPPSVDETAPVVFVSTPAVLPVTFSEIVQNVFAATVPPLRLMLVEPEVAPVTDPPQPLLRFGVLDTASPAGSASVNAKPVKVMELELVILIVSVVLAFSGILCAPKVLVMLGGDTTVTFALELLPWPPSVEFTGPAVL